MERNHQRRAPGRIEPKTAAAQEPETASTQQTDSPVQEQIAVLAYNLWEGRGCPVGSPEEDWFLAERMICDRARSEENVAREAERPLTMRTAGS